MQFPIYVIAYVILPRNDVHKQLLCRNNNVVTQKPILMKWKTFSPFKSRSLENLIARNTKEDIIDE